MKRSTVNVSKVVIATLTAAFVACGEGGPLSDEKDEEETSENQQTFSGSKGQVAQGVPQQTRNELFGVWSTGCQEDKRERHDEHHGGDGYEDSSDEMYADSGDDSIDGTGDEGQTDDGSDGLALQDDDTDTDSGSDADGSDGTDMEQDSDGSEGGNQDSEYYIETVEFRNGFRFTRSMWNDADCTEPNAVMEFHGSYLVGKESEVAEGARDLDLTFIAGFVTAHDEQMITGMNEMGFCGKSDWVSGERVDLSTIECGEDMFPPLNTAMLEIYKVEGNELFMGAKSDSETDEERPSALDTENPMTRE